MAEYATKLKTDLAEQFKGKMNIEALMDVIGVQLDEISEFYEQLKTERTLDVAIGQQLDGVGDIVVLSRAEAAILAGQALSAVPLSDEKYRKYLIYKVMKNTCNSTYYDIVRCINMFWNGPTLKYTEDPEIPATIIFDFDASSELTEQDLETPFIKAGGVGLYMRMHKEEDFTVYTGFALQRSAVETYSCNSAVIKPYTYLADEYNAIFRDETGAWLIE